MEKVFGILFRKEQDNEYLEEVDKIKIIKQERNLTMISYNTKSGGELADAL